MQVQPKDIAVISPYRRQVQKIREHMNKKFQRTPVRWEWPTVCSLLSAAFGPIYLDFAF